MLYNRNRLLLAKFIQLYKFDAIVAEIDKMEAFSNCDARCVPLCSHFETGSQSAPPSHAVVHFKDPQGTIESESV